MLFTAIDKNTRVSELTKINLQFQMALRQASLEFPCVDELHACLILLSKIYLADELSIHQAGIIHCAVAQMQGQPFQVLNSCLHRRVIFNIISIYLLSIVLQCFYNPYIYTVCMVQVFQADPEGIFEARGRVKE